MQSVGKRNVYAVAPLTQPCARNANLRYPAGTPALPYSPISPRSWVRSAPTSWSSRTVPLPRSFFTTLAATTYKDLWRQRVVLTGVCSSHYFITSYCYNCYVLYCWATCLRWRHRTDWSEAGRRRLNRSVITGAIVRPPQSHFNLISFDCSPIPTKLTNVIIQMQHIIEQKISRESVLNRNVLGAITETVWYGNKTAVPVRIESVLRPLYFLTVHYLLINVIIYLTNSFFVCLLQLKHLPIRKFPRLQSIFG